MIDESTVFRRRVAILIVFIALWCLFIVFRLVELQVFESPDLKARADNMHRGTHQVPALRGQIMDRNGRTLAISLWEPCITTDPSLLDNVPAVVDALAGALGHDEAWKKMMTRRLENKGKRFAYIDDRVTVAQKEAVEALNLKGVFISRRPWRKYPNGWLASHAVGFINGDETTREGLERSYSEAMAGSAGSMEVLRDGRGRKNGITEKVIKEPVDGGNLRLTMDLNIQLFLEDAMRRSMEATEAESISGIVMDPRNGAILAMANLPDYNPNAYSQASGELRRNRAVVDIYEPGSAFKIVTVAAALDLGTTRIDQNFFSGPQPIHAFDKRIRNHPPFGILSVPEILWHSSNAGVVQIALTMTPAQFGEYIERFGFGKRTGVDLPAESPGLYRPQSKWDRTSPYFLSMGHEIGTTPLQMLTAVSAVANGGLLVKPHIAHELEHADGKVVDLRPRAKLKRVLKEETARELAYALRGVVESGTAKSAAIEGVAVFGKTGTAQRIQSGTYARNKYNSSFVGFFPAEAPRYGMIVVVHDPKGSKLHGGDVAAPIFSEVGNRIMDYERVNKPRHKLEIVARTPNWKEQEPLQLSDTSTMPDFTGFGLRNLLQRARKLGLRLKIEGTGNVTEQHPLPGSPIPENRNCTIKLSEG